LRTDGGVDRADHHSQLAQLGSVRAQALADVLVEQLLDVHQALDQIAVLRGEVFIPKRELLDAVGLRVVANGANVGGDEQDRARERRLEA
jgi:hypothetical protein